MVDSSLNGVDNLILEYGVLKIKDNLGSLKIYQNYFKKI